MTRPRAPTHRTSTKHGSTRARLDDTRGQLGPLGVILVIAVIIIGMVAVVSLGGDALADSRHASELERAENTLLQLDNRGSLVSLGESQVQSLSLGATGNGQWDVVEDAGNIRITHSNFVNGSDETIYESPLGSLVYRNGDATVAYQGGGIWRSDDGETSVMVSAPEFHYRAETLVFPIVHVEGDDSAAGTRQAVLTGDDTFVRVYPNPTQTYQNHSDRGYANPVRGGAVSVAIQSDYYQAWARFFEKRSGGDITVDSTTKTVEVELSAPRFVGEFDMPDEDGHIPVRGITGGHALETFTLDLAPDDTDRADFHNLQWSLYIDDGPREMEIHLKLRTADDDKETACKEQLIEATVYYSDTNGNTYQGWHNKDAFRTTCTDRDDDGVADEVKLAANLSGTTPMYMTDLAANNLHYLDAKGTREKNVTFNEHSDTVSWEPVTYSDTDLDEAPIGHLIKHYLGLFGSDYNIVVTDQKSDSVTEDASTGVLEYRATGRVTYMHVTADNLHIDIR